MTQPGPKMEGDMVRPRLVCVVNVEKEVDEGVGVVHPTETKNDVGMEVGQSQSLGLDHGRDQNTKGCYEDRHSLIIDGLQFVWSHIPVPKGGYGG